MNHLPIAVLISGGGTTLGNLIHWYRMGELPVEFKVVISSRAAAGGLAIAGDAEIPTEIISRKEFEQHDAKRTNEAHSEAVFGLCRKLGVRLVVMGGYIEYLQIPEDFYGRVVNIHPSLIPAFSGKGFYGRKVHEAVLDYGVKLTGCTVHFVDDEFDHGPIIAQRSCPVLQGDTINSVQGRVFELECQLYPDVIGAIARKHVSVNGRQVLLQEIV